MSKEYVGTIVLEVDGQEIDVASVSANHETLRKVVKTMNRTGRAKGFAKTTRGYSLKVTAVVPKINPPNWDDIEDAKISIESEDGAFRESYLGCGVMSVGKQYDMENESRIDIEMFALDYVRE